MSHILKKKQRLLWIDAVKGIGIILVLIGHCSIPGVNQYIYLFHMPLFYIISGFCWNVDKNRALAFNSFAKKKFKGYIVPYFKIASICFVIFGIGCELMKVGLGSEYYYKLAKYIFGIIIYSRGTTEWLPNCSPIWFLTTLFLAELMLYWIMQQSKPVIYVVIAGILGYLCFMIGKVFPWNLDNAFTAIPFLYVGIVFKLHWNRISKLVYLPFLFSVSFLIFCYGKLGGGFDGNNLKYIYITGFESMVISVSILSLLYQMRDANLRILPYLGKNTLVLFGYNFAINSCLRMLSPINTWSMACVVMVVGIILVYLVNKYRFIKKILI